MQNNDKLLRRVLNKAEQIRQAVNKSHLFPNDLAGACGVSSLKLFMYGRKNNLPIFFGYKPDYHCFNFFGDYVIDITAAQFLDIYRDKVAFLEKEKAEKHSWWSKTMCAKNLRDFKTLDKEVIEFSLWSHQNPYIYSWDESKNTLQLK